MGLESKVVLIIYPIHQEITGFLLEFILTHSCDEPDNITLGWRSHTLGMSHVETCLLEFEAVLLHLETGIKVIAKVIPYRHGSFSK